MEGSLGQSAQGALLHLQDEFMPKAKLHYLKRSFGPPSPEGSACRCHGFGIWQFGILAFKGEAVVGLAVMLCVQQQAGDRLCFWQPFAPAASSPSQQWLSRIKAPLKRELKS